MNHDKLLELDISAYKAASDGVYQNKVGQEVNWAQQVAEATKSKISIPPEKQLDKPSVSHLSDTLIKVVNETTTSAARLLHDQSKHPLALNFANGHLPGGAFLNFGCRAQEEVLCRMSALYSTIVNDPMYEFHSREQGAESSDWAILSPDVPVFRDENYEPLDSPWCLSFITCAAPEAGIVGQPKAITLLRKRIHRIFEIAESYNYKSFVLGAWGCGAFGNNPDTTALDFKYALQNQFKGIFEEIIFAVYDPLEEGENLAAFRSVFKSS